MHEPQVPPQPSSPQSLPSHWGSHSHLLLELHVSFASQVPQEPPQPSLPHSLCFQFGMPGKVRG